MKTPDNFRGVDSTDPGQLVDLARFLRFPAELVSVIKKEAQRINGQPHLVDKLERCRGLIANMDCHDNSAACMHELKSISRQPFIIILFLSMVPRFFALHRNQGIPQSITIATLGDLKLWILECFRKNACWGIDEFQWLLSHFRGQLYRIGRLQYRMEPFGFDYLYFKNRKNRKTLLLYTGNKQARGGYRVIADARIDSKRVFPMDDEWQCILKKNQLAPAVHIPAGEPLTTDDCLASLQQAREFLGEQFPDMQVEAFTCHSWLLDPQLGKLLPPASNIVRFQQLFHLFPIQGADDLQCRERLFDNQDPSSLRNKTSLQKSVAAFMDSGGCIRMGGGILIPEVVKSAIRQSKPQEMI